jgi:hypothetical protein
MLSPHLSQHPQVTLGDKPSQQYFMGAVLLRMWSDGSRDGWGSEGKPAHSTFEVCAKLSKNISLTIVSAENCKEETIVSAESL